MSSRTRPPDACRRRKVTGLYVNELMEKREVSETEAEEINEQLKSKLSGTDSVIAKAGQMVSSIVNYPVYSVTGGRREASVKRFELIAVDANELHRRGDGRG